MKYIFLFAPLLLVGCGVRTYYPNGLPAFADYTNFKGVTKIKTKGFYFERNGTQDAATPTTATLNGARNIIMTGVFGGVTGAVIP